MDYKNKIWLIITRLLANQNKIPILNLWFHTIPLCSYKKTILQITGPNKGNRNRHFFLRIFIDDLLSLIPTSSLKSLYPCSSLMKYPLKTSWLSLFKTVWGWEAPTSFAISLRVSPSCSVFCLKKAINLFCNSSSFVMISLDEMNKFSSKKTKFWLQYIDFFDNVKSFLTKSIFFLTKE